MFFPAQTGGLFAKKKRSDQHFLLLHTPLNSLANCSVQHPLGRWLSGCYTVIPMYWGFAQLKPKVTISLTIFHSEIIFQTFPAEFHHVAGKFGRTCPLQPGAMPEASVVGGAELGVMDWGLSKKCRELRSANVFFFNGKINENHL